MSSKETGATLLANLLIELFQSEESAALHPEREWKRLGAVPPGMAMLAISRHARESLERFRALAATRGREPATGTLIGRLFSSVRDLSTDLYVSSEKSYRATLLGIHHGIGVVAFVEDAAIQKGDQELADTCSEWLVVRRQLAETVEQELSWFAEHPEIAIRRGPPKVALDRLLEPFRTIAAARS